MAEILKKDDFKRVELLNLITKKGHLKNLTPDQLVELDGLLKKKDYSNDKKAEKSKQIHRDFCLRNGSQILVINLLLVCLQSQLTTWLQLELI